MESGEVKKEEQGERKGKLQLKLGWISLFAYNYFFDSETR